MNDPAPIVLDRTGVPSSCFYCGYTPVYIVTERAADGYVYVNRHGETKHVEIKTHICRGCNA